jgi:3-hydroxybutyryl-CoA dehydrogenase
MRLGIAGSGAIATGLARAAGPVLDTVLWARSETSAERARAAVGDAAKVVHDLGALSDRDFVVEAIAEDRQAKRELLERLGAELGAECLIATTTSSLSIAMLAEASGRPDRFGALHVFNPVERMKLVELVFPPEAPDEVRRRFHDLCEAIHKTAVEVPDTPGFVVNRLLFPYLFEAVRLVDETGLDPHAVDSCMKLGAGHPMGPLALLDMVGLDVAVAIGESIGSLVPVRLHELVAEGRLGRKTRAGIFDY